MGLVSYKIAYYAMIRSVCRVRLACHFFDVDGRKEMTNKMAKQNMAHKYLKHYVRIHHVNWKRKLASAFIRFTSRFFWAFKLLEGVSSDFTFYAHRCGCCWMMKSLPTHLAAARKSCQQVTLFEWHF